MKILLAEGHVSPEDWREVEHECERCSEPLKREEHIKCADCAEVYVMDMAQEDWSFASENEINDPQLMFDTFADSIVGASKTSSARYE
jgi:hypothetical protein